jgi:hypothetical protein
MATTSNLSALPSDSTSPRSLQSPRELLENNLRLQNNVRLQLDSLQLNLFQLTDLLLTLKQDTAQDFASPKSRFQHYHRDASAATHNNPFRGKRCAAVSPSTSENIFVMFPSPFSTPLLDWNVELDDLLRCAVDSCRLEMQLDTKDSPTDVHLGRADATHGLSMKQWRLVAEYFNSGVEGNRICRSLALRRASEIDCMLRYTNAIMCSTATFASDEDTKLLSVVDSIQRQRDADDDLRNSSRISGMSWSSIAIQISNVRGLRRSAFQCAARYQSVLNERFLPPLNVAIHDLVQKATIQEAVLRYGERNWGALCLALNNHYKQSPASTSHRTFGGFHSGVEYWIPYQRMFSFASRLHTTIDDESNCKLMMSPCVAVSSRRTIATSTVALLAVQAIFMLALDASISHSLVAILKLLNDPTVAHAEPGSTTTVVDLVDLNDMISAQKVFRAQCSTTTSLKDCAALLKCAEDEVRDKVVREWSRKARNCELKAVAIRLFGRPQYVGVVRTLLLQHLLCNVEASQKKVYPLLRIPPLKRINDE